MSGLGPGAIRWLAAQGVRPTTVRRLEAASTAELFAIDDLVLRWYKGGTLLDVLWSNGMISGVVD